MFGGLGIGCLAGYDPRLQTRGQQGGHKLQEELVAQLHAVESPTRLLADFSLTACQLTHQPSSRGPITGPHTIQFFASHEIKCGGVGQESIFLKLPSQVTVTIPSACA